MSFWTDVRSRLAVRAPPWKIGTVIDGVNAHAAEPALNNPLRDALAVPALPVKLIVGKNAARAAPMLAFSERRTASACRMSGRRVSRSDGDPAGTSTRIGYRQADHRR